MAEDIVLINVPGPGDPSVVEVVGPGDGVITVPNPPADATLGPRVSAAEIELDAHRIRIDTLEDSDDWQDSRLLALEAASGDPDAVQEIVDASVGAHIADTTPHPAYDDLPSLTLRFLNGLV
jgi:hypothetical protein